MEFKSKQTYTLDFVLFLFVPLVILFFFIVSFNSGFVLLLIPTIILLFFVQTELDSFNEMEGQLDIVRRVSHQRVNESSEIVVTLKIKNNSEFDSAQIELIDDIPEVFDIINSTNIFMFSLKKNEEIELTYNLSCHQIGIFTFKSVFVTHTDLFGLIIESFTVNPEKVMVTVTPNFEKFEKLPIFSYWMKYFNGFFVSKQIGDDTDFRGIRNYQFGDKFQRINWKKTSRYQSTGSQNFFTNLYSFDKAIDAELVFDLTYETYSTYHEEIKAICSLAEFLLRTRNKLGITVAKQFSQHFQTRMGTKQLKIVIDKLLSFHSDSQLNSTIILDRLMYLSKNFKSKSLIIVISPLINSFIIEYCKQIKQRGYTIVVIKINSLEKQLSNISTGKYHDDITLNVPLFFNIVSFDFLVKNFIIKREILTSSIPLLEWKSDDQLKGVLSKYKYGIRL